MYHILEASLCMYSMCVEDVSCDLILGESGLKVGDESAFKRKIWRINWNVISTCIISCMIVPQTLG